MAKKKPNSGAASFPTGDYGGLLGEVVLLLEVARRTSVRAVNAVMTATYWEIGRRIVVVEQQGSVHANYGEDLIKRLASDLSARFGRGFAWRNVYQMRAFHLAYRNILQRLQNVPIRCPQRNCRRRLQFSNYQMTRLRHRLEGSRDYFDYHGRTMSNSSPSRTKTRGVSMKQKRCEAAGQCGNSIDKSAAFSTSERCCQRTKPRCCERGSKPTRET